MSLSEVLKALAQKNCASISAPDMAVLLRATLKLKLSGIVDKSIQSGETAPNFPLGFNQQNADSLYDLLESSGPAIVTFFRGTWCSYCQAQLNAFESILPDLESKNISFIAISPDGAGEIESEKNNYVKIHDIDNAIAREYRLVYELEEDQQNLFERWKNNLAFLHDSDKWELPVPSTFLVGSDRRVKYRHMNVDFRQRLDPEEVVGFFGRKIS